MIIITIIIIVHSFTTRAKNGSLSRHSPAISSNPSRIKRQLPSSLAHMPHLQYTASSFFQSTFAVYWSQWYQDHNMKVLN